MHWHDTNLSPSNQVTFYCFMLYSILHRLNNRITTIYDPTHWFVSRNLSTVEDLDYRKTSSQNTEIVCYTVLFIGYQSMTRKYLDFTIKKMLLSHVLYKSQSFLVYLLNCKTLCIAVSSRATSVGVEFARSFLRLASMV